MKVSEKGNPKTIIKFLGENDAPLIDFEPKTGKTTVRYDGDNTIIYAGFTDVGRNLLEFKKSCAAAIRTAKKIKHESVGIVLPQQNEFYAAAAVEAAVLANYDYDYHKTEKGTKIKDFYVDFASAEKVLNARIVAESVNYARTIVNENAAVITPEFLAQEAVKIAETNQNMSTEVLDENQIRESGLGLLSAVGKGSATPPRLIIIKYNGDKESNEYTAIVGKGLTFDSGGLCLKPAEGMESMRHDCAGAAAVLGVLQAAAKLSPTINFLAVIPSAQNAIGKDAYYVGDVYTSYSQKTVEVLNTDAEGRLILADAISYAIKNYSPAQIIDLATLTGAIVMALGKTIAGAFSNNIELSANLFDSGENVGENIWQMPIRPEHHEMLKSDIADIMNISLPKRQASSITAAAFLEEFVENTPWCHLDIAGTAWNDSAATYLTPKYATGFGVRLLWDFLNK
jgi:leucyl aminopeptidase